MRRRIRVRPQVERCVGHPTRGVPRREWVLKAGTSLVVGRPLNSGILRGQSLRAGTARVDSSVVGIRGGYVAFSLQSPPPENMRIS
jgi:hypothetical protein